jgi:hypothetical protein
LVEVPGSPFILERAGNAIYADANGTHLFVASTQLDVYVIDGITGEPSFLTSDGTPLGTVSTIKGLTLIP